MSDFLYKRVKQRFEEYLEKGIGCMVAYHAHPINPEFITKLKKDGFKLKPYQGNKGLFIEITK